MSNFNIFSDNLNNIFKDKGDGDFDDTVTDSDIYLNQNRGLWRAVILQGIIDIINNSSRTENKIAKIESKQWIFQDNEDFKEVCGLAGYTVQYVRKKVMEIMRQNCISKIIINKTTKEDKFAFFVQNLSLGRMFDFKMFDYEKKVVSFA